MGLVVRKTCLREGGGGGGGGGGGVYKECFKPVSSAIETSLKVEISPAARLHMIVTFQKANKKALLRLRGCAGWSAPVFFPKTPKTGFLASRPIL